MMWSQWFGPSREERLLAMMQTQQDKVLAALTAQQEATTALLTEVITASKAQTDLATKQLDLLTAPAAQPQVRLMTRAEEAKAERRRVGTEARRKAATGTTIPTDTFLAGLSAELAAEAQTY